MGVFVLTETLDWATSKMQTFERIFVEVLTQEHRGVAMIAKKCEGESIDDYN